MFPYSKLQNYFCPIVYTCPSVVSCSPQESFVLFTQTGHGLFAFPQAVATFSLQGNYSFFKVKCVLFQEAFLDSPRQKWLLVEQWAQTTAAISQCIVSISLWGFKLSNSSECEHPQALFILAPNWTSPRCSSTDEWVVIHAHHSILVGNERKQATATYNNMKKLLKHDAEWKSQIKEHIPSDFISAKASTVWFKGISSEFSGKLIGSFLHRFQWCINTLILLESDILRVWSMSPDNRTSAMTGSRLNMFYFPRIAQDRTLAWCMHYCAQNAGEFILCFDRASFLLEIHLFKCNMN